MTTDERSQLVGLITVSTLDQLVEMFHNLGERLRESEARVRELEDTVEVLLEQETRYITLGEK